MEVKREIQRNIGLSEISILTISIISFATLRLSIAFWIIVSDITGLYFLVPSSIFVIILPGFTVALLPGVVGLYLYDLKHALWIGGVMFFISTAYIVGACMTMEHSAYC